MLYQTVPLTSHLLRYFRVVSIDIDLLSLCSSNFWKALWRRFASHWHLVAFGKLYQLLFSYSLYQLYFLFSYRGFIVLTKILTITCRFPLPWLFIPIGSGFTCQTSRDFGYFHKTRFDISVLSQSCLLSSSASGQYPISTSFLSISPYLSRFATSHPRIMFAMCTPRFQTASHCGRLLLPFIAMALYTFFSISVQYSHSSRGEFSWFFCQMSGLADVGNHGASTDR